MPSTAAGPGTGRSASLTQSVGTFFPRLPRPMVSPSVARSQRIRLFRWSIPTAPACAGQADESLSASLCTPHTVPLP